MARLRIKREGREDEVLPISSDIVTLGRSSEATIPIEDHGSSRKHAQIERFEGGYKLVDLESRNGTRVNGVHVNQHLLQWNDEIQIGKTTIIWEAGDSELLPPESSGDLSPAAAAVAGVKPPRVHITRRRTRTLRKGAYGLETKILIAIVTISVLGGLVVFLKREDPSVVIAMNHMSAANATRQKAEALHRVERSSQTIREQIDLFSEALKEYQAVPASASDYFRPASEKAQEIEKAIRELKEALPGFRAHEIREFLKAHAEDLDGVKKLVAEFRKDFPGHPEGVKLDAMLKEATTVKPEDLTAQYAAIETEVDAFVAQDRFGDALHALQTFADGHPSSSFSEKANQRIKDIQTQAGAFWETEHAKAQALVTDGKVADAVAVYDRVLAACGDESLLSDYVLQAKSELKQLQDKKDK